MQGRLSPRPAGRAQAFPLATWRREFDLARQIGFDHIEWLVTAPSFDANPLLASDGIAEIREAIADSGVGVRSVCADCFIEQPLVRIARTDRQSRADQLEQLLVNSRRLGAAVVVIPVLEGNAVRDPSDEADLLEVLRGPLSIAERIGVRVGLESELSGTALKSLIALARTPALGACLDFGNAVVAGHDVAADIRTLGPMLCGVHIKDRTHDGDSRMLGNGEVDFCTALAALAGVGYCGPLVLETPVGDDPIASARANRAFITAQ